MRINSGERYAINRALNKIGFELGVDIYVMKEDWDIPAVFGVNWSAQGTQSTETAKDYAMKIVKAAEIADMLTGMKMVTDYTLQMKRKDIDGWNEICDRIEEAIYNGDGIVELLDKVNDVFEIVEA